MAVSKGPTGPEMRGASSATPNAVPFGELVRKDQFVRIGKRMHRLVI